MTKEEIKRNFEYRAWKKEIMVEFPIINNIDLDTNLENDWDNYDSVFFTEAELSLSKIQEMFPNWQLKSYVKYLLENEGEIFKIFTLHEVFDTDDEVSIDNFEKGLSDNTWEFHRDLNKRTEVPKSMKLPKIPTISRFRLVE
jgi:hypothetical protein